MTQGIEFAVRYTDRIFGNVRTIRDAKAPTLDRAQAARIRTVAEWPGYDIGCHIVYRAQPGADWRTLDRMPAPGACRWCVLLPPDHGRCWSSLTGDDGKVVGDHAWTAPTAEQVKARMLVRRLLATAGPRTYRVQADMFDGAWYRYTLTVAADGDDAAYALAAQLMSDARPGEFRFLRSLGLTAKAAAPAVERLP
ncbi:hypothetical protein F5972_08630 [Microbispora cellulosiformans]|uniref:Uncharacterized protein n=1 Tax=Microbispora cellulosiformans TaxID=2614688 RepID=A0A5J5K599_9ACTN|nr:hypothetical protein [Microbispora cellulosiformans]KAA9379706.1 hypothetical protein F5972_08630 [Microbispora cellulosiformans]